VGEVDGVIVGEVEGAEEGLTVGDLLGEVV
jgi:hypothetical protein